MYIVHAEIIDPSTGRREAGTGTCNLERGWSEAKSLARSLALDSLTVWITRPDGRRISVRP